MTKPEDVIGNVQEAAKNQLSQFLANMPQGWGQLIQAALSGDRNGMFAAMEALAKSGTEAGKPISGNDLGTGGLASNAPQINDVSQGIEGRV